MFSCSLSFFRSRREEPLRTFSQYTHKSAHSHARIYFFAFSNLFIFFFTLYDVNHRENRKRALFEQAAAPIRAETAEMETIAIPSASGSVMNPCVIRFVSPCASLPSAPQDVRNSDAPNARLNATNPSARFAARSSIAKSEPAPNVIQYVRILFATRSAQIRSPSVRVYVRNPCVTGNATVLRTAPSPNVL